MSPNTEEIDVSCPKCRHDFTVELEEVDTAPAAPTPNPPAPPSEPTRYYKLKEAGEILSVSRSALKRWIQNGTLKAVQFGSGGSGTPWRVSAAELARLTKELENS
jgi:excisionase family DNA binding protein